MFTEKGQALIDLAKDYAFTSGSADLSLEALLTAMSAQVQARVLLVESTGVTSEKLKELCLDLQKTTACPGTLPVSEAVRQILFRARELAEKAPDRAQQGLVDMRHMVCAVAVSHDACSKLGVKALPPDKGEALLASWYEKDVSAPRLEELTERFRKLRATLLEKVFGQDHAVHAFVEGLFNAEVVAMADTKRKSPRSLFVFAGPPGVGKTFLAETAAASLDRPFKRFDMSAYSGNLQYEALVGMAKSFHASHPGTLTGFVEKNPNAILLFDEIERAHSNAILLFLQLLDGGVLEDKYFERNVTFTDTTIIFTTNAGRRLYEQPNMTGVHTAHSGVHRKTILDALENDKNPQTGEQFFPPALCSRLATGYPVLFNYLRVNELERVVRTELERVSGLFERQYLKQITFHDLLPICLVLRESGRTDARTLRSQAEAFVKTEIFKFCQLFKSDRIEDVMASVKNIHLTLEGESRHMAPEVRELFESQEPPRVLLVATPTFTELCAKHLTQVTWLTANSTEAALQILADETVDLVLLDLWVGAQSGTTSMTMRNFDHVPAGARSLGQGQELLRKLNERLPELPVYLLSRDAAPKGDGGGGAVDDDLFMACVRVGGARGMIATRFVNAAGDGWEEARDAFAEQLVLTARRLYRERAAERMARERMVLSFDTVPNVNKEKQQVSIRLRNLALSRALSASDAGEVLQDVERPATRFADVIGADTAKAELQFFIDYLKNPKRYAALGLKPPKGVLLYGPPGTGKTMLARAMAGESNLAFIPANASNFVTMWQGSGPQSVRELFVRARRYAPAIIFIDEIDAVGRSRSGIQGAGHGEEMALNALLAEMDGFLSASFNRPVFVLAATNFRVAEERGSRDGAGRTLDPALVRRFSRTILVDLPDTAVRRQYLNQRFCGDGRRSISEGLLDVLAEKTAGMSISELETVFESAARAAAKQGGELTEEMLREALDTAREGEVKGWSSEFLTSTARHEAGHTVMYWLSGFLPTEVSIIARGMHGGGMRRSEAETKRECLTQQDLLANVRTLLGGRGAEMVCYGPQSGLTTGASSDLEQATHIVRQMICRFGMDEEFGLLAAPELDMPGQGGDAALHQKVNERARGMLKEQMALTLDLLGKHRQQLDDVTKALLEKNRLSRKDLESLLPTGVLTTRAL